MKFYYSSMYIKETINNFDELKEKIDSKAIELYLDTNICIYLRDFYKEPSSIVKRLDIWNELKTLLRNIESNDLIVDYSIGLEEACRNKNNFDINNEKLIDMSESIRALFNMDYFKMIEHSHLIKFETPVKDTTIKGKTKINSLESINIFQNLLFVNYACLLKMWLLDRNQNESSNVQLMLEFLEFVEQEVDIFSIAIIIFAHHYFSGNETIRKLIHKSKNKVEEKLHSIWNAAIDLTFPTIVSQCYVKTKLLPVFVTADKNLWLIFDSMKIKVIVQDDEKMVHPPVVEGDLSKTCWSEEELIEINKYYNDIQNRRKYKFVFDDFNQEKLLDNLRIICKNLEDDLRRCL